eukprot:303504-Rhodomonas_salina.8
MMCSQPSACQELPWLNADFFLNAGWEICDNYGDPNTSLKALQTAARLRFDGLEGPQPDTHPWKRKIWDAAAEIALRGWAHSVGLGLREHAGLVLPKVGG